MGRAALALAAALGPTLAGCGGEAKGPVLAEVGETPIHASQLRRYEERLAESLRSRKAGVEGPRQHLQALIDKEILIQEAAARGWDRDPEMRRKLHREWTERLVNEFLAREVDAKVTLEDQEVRDHYLETGRDRAVKAAKIVVESREEAEEIVGLLEGGVDFGELARQRSIHRPTAEEGGRYAGYATGDQMPLAVMQEKVYPLAVGQITEPISLPGGTYGVFTVVEEIPVPLERVRSVVETELHRQKARLRSTELGRELREALDLQPREDGFDLLEARLESEERAFSEADRTTVLYEFDGGTITVGDLVDSARENYREFSGEAREQARWFAESVLVPRALIVQAALNAGIDREPKMAAWRRAREDERLLTVIRKEVTGEVQADGDEALRFYEQNHGLFVPHENLALDEILVATPEEAAAFRDRIEAGEDLRLLAAQHTLRRLAAPDSGRFHLHWYQRDVHTALFEAARGAAPGDLVGPVEVEMPASEAAAPGGAEGRYYSVFRIVESTLGAGPRPFAEVEARARAMVLRRKRDAAFYRFLGELRKRYEPRVRIHEEHLSALVHRDSG